MARYQARKLYRDLMAETRDTGFPIRNEEDLKNTRTFAAIREACGIERDGRPMRECWGADLEHRTLKEGWEKNTDELTIPVRRRTETDLADWSIRDLWENLVISRNGDPVGREGVRYFCDPDDPQAGKRMYEAAVGGAVDSSLFYGITGQLLIASILKSFIRESNVITNLCGTYPTNMTHGERIPGMGLPADPDSNHVEDVTLVPENGEIKYVGFSEEYIELPDTQYRALGIGVTRKAVYEDRTGLILQRAADVGTILGLRKEKRLIGAVIGGTINPVRFREKRAFDNECITLDMYQQASAGSGTYQLAYTYSTRPYPWVNDIPSNPLDDWKAFRTADQYFSKIVDPNTGEPIEIGRPFVLLPYTRRWDLIQIAQALNIFKLTQGVGQSGAWSPGNVLTQTPTSALAGLMAQQFATSRQLRKQLIEQLSVSEADADHVWFNGDFGEAVKYSENWPLQVVQAPPMSEAEFSRDIIARFKAFERGQAAIWNPRMVQRHNYLSCSSGQ